MEKINKANFRIISRQPQQQFIAVSKLAKSKTSLEKQSAVGVAQISGNEQIYFENSQVDSYTLNPIKFINTALLDSKSGIDMCWGTKECIGCFKVDLGNRQSIIYRPGNNSN
ncbi:hypothetical protein EDC44_12827 [Cricetibacter osteomyelitidis]|uniref:Uncharacterized protein n=1 Tax=Cricetibacter osteomyelitidis TaxID=1521931 RepID=A0A4R2SUR8_9PAST|nr:hypothetical protein [Cricetibacter osteomyelitidis]TCP92074.1 hypothetical protein EDC44_12827 [Cricetibacter osteomyelitidis]